MATLEFKDPARAFIAESVKYKANNQQLQLLVYNDELLERTIPLTSSDVSLAKLVDPLEVPEAFPYVEDSGIYIMSTTELSSPTKEYNLILVSKVVSAQEEESLSYNKVVLQYNDGGTWYDFAEFNSADQTDIVVDEGTSASFSMLFKF
jgi:hypothetical protein